MKKNLKGFLETVQTAEAECLVDMNQYDMIEASGFFPDLRHKKSAHMTAGWKISKTPRTFIPMGDSDLSACRFLTFSVFAAEAKGGSFRLIFDNGNAGEGKNGYAAQLPVMHDGWNHYRMELPFLRAVGEPAGWDHIGGICFIAEGFDRDGAVLYVDSMYVYRGNAAPLYSTLPELKGAAAFAKGGNYAIVDRKRLANTIDGSDARPVEENGVLYLPMAPVAAGIARSAVVDNRACTLSFTYRRKKYFFSADSDRMTVNGEAQKLGFFPKNRDGNLYFPAEFIREFFHWRQLFRDPMGLIVLSNRKGIFDSGFDFPVIRQLTADLTCVRPTGERILNDLHRRFPNPLRGRLLASFDEWMQLRRDVKADGVQKKYYAALKANFGTSSPAFAVAPEYAADPLASSEKLLAFAALFRLSGDRRYCDRAADEINAICGAENWDGASVAEFGETALAVALAYDWCKHAWSEAQKAGVERNLLRKGMRVGLDYYDGKRKMWESDSAAAASVNCGMLASALTLADVFPETALKLLDRVPRNAEKCFAAFAPDGGVAEGVPAWAQSARALCVLILLFRKSCGTDYGFASLPGFAQSAYFPFYTETANGAWNYHDFAAAPVDTSSLPMFSTLTGDPIPAWWRARELAAAKKAVSPLDLLFYVPSDPESNPRLPLDKLYRRAGLAAMRSGWGENGLFVGLHVGGNRVSGAEPDAGSVILEAGGKRFFEETGKIAGLAESVRLSTAGQNVYTVVGTDGTETDQSADAYAPIVEMRGGEDRAYAVADMTSAYGILARAKRGVMLTERRTTAVIRDELTVREPAEIVWGVWTRAQIELKGSRTAVLNLDGQKLICKLIGAGGAGFGVTEYPETGVRRLTVRAAVKEKLRIALVCRLAQDGEDDPKITCEPEPISAWGKEKEDR